MKKLSLKRLPSSVVLYADGRLHSPTNDVINGVLYELPVPLKCSWPRCNNDGSAVYARKTKKSRPWRVLCQEHVERFLSEC